jgi:hypothetical protein
VEWWAAGLWGLAGGAAIEAVDLYKTVHTADGGYSLPKGGRDFWLAYLIAMTIRLGLGFVCAAAVADHVSAPVGALGVGVGATGFLEHLGRSPRPAATQQDNTAALAAPPTSVEELRPPS